MHEGSLRGEERIGPACQSGQLPVLYAAHPRRGSHPIRGGGIFERKGPGSSVADRTWSMGCAAMFREHLCSALGLPPAIIGLGGSIVKNCRSSSLWRFYLYRACKIFPPTAENAPKARSGREFERRRAPSGPIGSPTTTRPRDESSSTEPLDPNMRNRRRPHKVFTKEAHA